MSADRIDQLHEQASEHYLNGDYSAAIVAWKELLELDPANEQALEGVRMSTMLGEGADTEVTLGRPEDPSPEPVAREASVAPAPVAPAFEAEIDQGLSVFDSIPAPAKAAARGTSASPDATQVIDRTEIDAMLRQGAIAHETDPRRQDDGIDFGDIAEVAAIPLATTVQAEVDSGSYDAPARLHDDGEAVGLDLLGDSSPRAPKPAAGSSVAEEALQRRVQDLLAEARARRDEGDRAAALGVIARIFILDEGNAQARALEAELRDASASDLAAIEEWIIEGVQAFDQGRLAEARDLFTKVAERSPGHLEAQHYLEAIAERETGHGDIPQDLLGDPGQIDGPPVGVTPPRAPTIAAGFEDSVRHPRDRGPRPAAPEPQAPARRFSVPKWVVAAGLGVALVAAGVVFVPGLLGSGAGHEAPARETPGPSARPPRAAPGAAARRPAKVPAPAAAPRPQSVGEALDRAQSAMARADFGAAVLAFNEAIALDPANERARAGIQEAGDLYKAKKAEQEQLDRVRMAFKDGEYASALRVLYRLPDTIDKAKVERWKVDGWFNLGVVALRAGEAPQAITHFDEALAILPDPDATRWRTFSQRYRNVPKDRAFYDAVEAIPFRTLD